VRHKVSYTSDDGKVEVNNPRDGDITKLETEPETTTRNLSLLLEQIEKDYRSFQLRPEQLIEVAELCYDLVKGDHITIKRLDKSKITYGKGVNKHVKEPKEETLKTRRELEFI
jgi:hypothetical protein